MAERRTRRRFTREYKAQAVQRVIESGRPLADIAAELAVSPGQLSQLCIDALVMALQRCRPPRGLLHHSDRGVQGGFKWSSQQGLCELFGGTGPEPRPGFS